MKLKIQLPDVPTAKEFSNPAQYTEALGAWLKACRYVVAGEALAAGYYPEAEEEGGAWVNNAVERIEAEYPKVAEHARLPWLAAVLREAWQRRKPAK